MKNDINEIIREIHPPLKIKNDINKIVLEIHPPLKYNNNIVFLNIKLYIYNYSIFL